MAVLKKKIKNILGFISIGFLVVGAIFFILTKESNQKTNSSNREFNQEKHNSSFGNQETEKTKLICSQILEESENDLTFNEYANATQVECTSVGCGGFF